jgi:hypothetical protein
MDALARVAAQSGEVDGARSLLHLADDLAAASRDLLDDGDRTDAHLTRALVAAPLT